MAFSGQWEMIVCEGVLGEDVKHGPITPEKLAPLAAHGISLRWSSIEKGGRFGFGQKKASCETNGPNVTFFKFWG